MEKQKWLKKLKINWSGVGSSTLLSLGPHRSGPSLSRIRKSIHCCHFEDFTAEELCGVKQHLEPMEEKKKRKKTPAAPLMCFTSLTAVVRRFQQPSPLRDHITTSFQSPAAETAADLPSEPENHPLLFFSLSFFLTGAAQVSVLFLDE